MDGSASCGLGPLVMNRSARQDAKLLPACLRPPRERALAHVHQTHKTCNSYGHLRMHLRMHLRTHTYTRTQRTPCTSTSRNPRTLSPLIVAITRNAHPLASMAVVDRTCTARCMYGDVATPVLNLSQMLQSTAPSVILGGGNLSQAAP